MFSCVFYWNSRDTWNALLRACAAARHSIDFETYIFNPDNIGREFVDVFVAKAQAGVRVRLLLDAVGSYTMIDHPFSRRLIASGVELVFFNPINPWRIHTIFSWFLRTHRKIAVIDGAIGFIGGVNVSDHMESWRDTHAQIEGALVRHIHAAFSKMFQVASTPRFLQFKKRFRRPIFLGECAVASNSPRIRQRFIYHELRRVCASAQRSILIQTPYFIPSIRLMRWITRAAKRGVNVHIMIPDQFDVSLAGYATDSYISRLLHRNITVWRYPDSFLHAKMVSVDGVWATFGSANIDNLSLLLNYEANIFCRDTSTVRALEDHFWIDVKKSYRITHDIWIRRSRTRKFFEFLTLPLHGIL